MKRPLVFKPTGSGRAVVYKRGMAWSNNRDGRLLEELCVPEACDGDRGACSAGGVRASHCSASGKKTKTDAAPVSRAPLLLNTRDEPACLQT
ncbi:hypothetical protein NDU88_004537 [Pleurodeles waltl]|uniref:Uncharacterized protein n=1 Tax=Pleurodeles waltl TaxID=8319 RepID=A0AAV7W7S4_PLEWA|nr:hypothetical protein NDU88_004537 [Pleurodeles waltl]